MLAMWREWGYNIPLDWVNLQGDYARAPGGPCVGAPPHDVPLARKARMTPHRGPWAAQLAAAAVLVGFLGVPGSAAAQSAPPRVSVRTADEGPHGPLELDRGATGLWQKLLKLRTTASVLYTTAHPDDEESGVLTLLSRGMGVRTALLTLNRGEGGANALGSELFDALGLVRTEELRLAGRWYGLDDQYFTTAVDYGFSKTLDEAMRSWDREALLGDMVRAIRTNRPLVVISRWYGGERDGHGHHQASGVLTPLAVRAAADPGRFPEQITREHLRPWTVKRLYRGRVREGEPMHMMLDPGRTDPWLARSYREVGAEGLSLQRSQTAGRTRSSGSPAPSVYQRLIPPDGDTGPEAGLGPFDGLDVSLPGIFSVLGETPPAGAVAQLNAAAADIDAAVGAFRMDDTGAVADHLASALHALRSARRATPETSEADFHLAVKERQLADALAAALGLRLEAVATPPGADPDTPMGPAVAGGAMEVHLRLEAGGDRSVPVPDLTLRAPDGWAVRRERADDRAHATGRPAEAVFFVRLPRDAVPSRPWFFRESVAENVYQVRDSSALGLAEAPPPLVAVATVEVRGERFTITRPVRTLERDAPYGTPRRRLAVVPRLSLHARPAVHVLPVGRAEPFDVTVEVASADARPVDARVTLDLPPGWSASPTVAPAHLEGAGQRASVGFSVTPPPGAAGGDPPRDGWTLSASARVDGDPAPYAEGYEVIRHRDLGLRYLYEPARITVVPVDLAVAQGPPARSVGYVMGVGDAVPAALEELGARVTLLDEGALAGGDLSAYDAVVVGTRAYAVRPDLVAATPRLLSWVRNGGHMVVLYQTPEFDPRTQAPLPATLPGNAEEASEEDAPVTILAPEHPLLTAPNRIGASDFEGWIEQRGSKFFASWDAGYTPLVETHDTGQAPQRGVWLAADVGEGSWTYVALALHRQLPYGVAGAYRILANLIAQGR